jgi:hypothetical protein
MRARRLVEIFLAASFACLAPAKVVMQKARMKDAMAVRMNNCIDVLTQPADGIKRCRPISTGRSA